MKIVKLAYAHVKPGQQIDSLTLREHDAKVDAFLVDHVHDLRERGARGDSPFARFTDDVSRDLFEKLRAGSDEQFLTSAETLTKRLIGEMNGTTANGLLVCLHIEHDAEPAAAALKLEVLAEHGAVLEQLQTGEMKLSSATDVLQVPGDLQKGALVPDPRSPESEVVVGDQLTVNALYFPRALGIVTEQRSADTAASLVAAVHRHRPAVSAQVADELPSLASGSTREVLRQVAAAVPELDENVIAEVERDLVGAKRPVNHVDTGGPVKKVVSVDGITISGTSSAMGKVKIENDAEVGWRITIETTTDPKVEFKR